MPIHFTSSTNSTKPVEPTNMIDLTTRDSPKRSQARGFVLAVTAVMAVMAKRAIQLPRKLKAALPEPPTTREDRKIELRSPKKLLSKISSKTLSFKQRKKKKKKGEVEWGDGGVWQKTILMGDKCEPLDFSGVIYYDSNGKQVNDLPLRSPRASPMPGFFMSHKQPKHL